jgi:hypothetical protein
MILDAKTEKKLMAIYNQLGMILTENEKAKAPKVSSKRKKIDQTKQRRLKIAS